ncbi:hypothetical protein ACDL92_06340 [Ihubacter sp. mB4P-1]|uniref:hypothetical protein n=1 Tax=Ihubacter sp. mB4P-1 TaxID=3242370 RepID=UPI003C79A4B7
MEDWKIKEYSELADQILCQVYTKNNVNRMKNTIAHKKDFQVQYSRGGLLIARGYYCPSLLEEIFITNVRRGKLLARSTKKRPDYCYYFDKGKLILVQRNLDDETVRYEWIDRIGDFEYSLYMEDSDNFRIIISKYYNGKIIENTLLTYFYAGYFDLVLETYNYDQNRLVFATRKDISVFDKDHGYEDTHDFSFYYDDKKKRLKCIINGEDELPIPPVVEALITGQEAPENQRSLRETDVIKAMKQIVKGWKKENIYAISVFINHSEDEVTDFAISYNREEQQEGEERWNYAFWEQDEEELMYLLEERETSWKQLLDLTAFAVRKLQEERFFNKVFGKDIAVIIHGYDYEDVELEATRQANPNNQAKEFFSALKLFM